MSASYGGDSPPPRMDPVVDDEENEDAESGQPPKERGRKDGATLHPVHQVFGFHETSGEYHCTVSGCTYKTEVSAEIPTMWCTPVFVAATRGRRGKEWGIAGAVLLMTTGAR